MSYQREENRSLLIHFGIVTLVSVLVLLLYVFLIPTNDFEKQFGVGAKLVDVEVTNEIVKKQSSVVKGKKVLGSTFVVEASGSYDVGEGAISLELSLNGENKITGYEILEYEHTSGNFKDNSIAYLDYLVENNVLVSDVELNKDITGSTRSQELMVKMIKEIAVVLELVEQEKPVEPEEPKDKYEEAFGSGVTFENVDVNNAFVKSHKKALLAGASVGFVYEIEKSGSFDVGEGIVRLELMTDLDNNILGYDYLEYTHTPSFQEKVTEFMNYLVDNNVNIENVDINQGDITGSTRTRQLIVSMIKDLLSYVNDEEIVEPEPEEPKDKYEAAFGESVTLESVTIENVVVKSHKKAVANDVVVGFVYELEKSGSYDVGEGIVRLELMTDLDNNILGYDYLEYTHTPGFQGKVTEFMDYLVDNNVNIENVKISEGDITGSTRTRELIVSMIEALTSYVNEEGPNIYDDLFGGDTDLDKVHIIGTNVLSHNEIKKTNKLVGHSFVVDGTGIYFSSNIGKIELEIITNKEFEIIGYQFVSYGHTPAGNRPHYDLIVDYLDSLVNDKVKVSVAATKEDDVTGATNTGKIIVKMFVKLNEYIETLLSKYDKALDVVNSELKDLPFTTETVKSHKEIYDGETLIGHSFIIEGSGKYFNENIGKVVFEIITNINYEILGYEEVLYEHTAGNFKNNVIAYLNYILDNKVKVEDVTVDTGDISGSTNSRNIIADMFSELNSYIGGK